ncbi:MAG: SET domain-containing protein [Elusimicrobiota bacterium]
MTRRIIRDGYFGLFAEERIPKGSVIGRSGGVLVTSAADAPPGKDYAALVAEGLLVVPHDYDNPGLLDSLNHSCRSNVARYGALLFVAKEDIRAGEEMTIDYAPLTAGLPERWEMSCACGQPGCRKLISSEEWHDPGLAAALWPEWLPFIQRKMLEAGIV